MLLFLKLKTFFIKIKFISSFILGCTTILLWTSCSKSSEKATQQQYEKPSAFSQLSDEQLIDTIKNDKDWQIVAENNYLLIEKFISKKIDLSTFDFTNEQAFLAVIDMDKSTYLTQVIRNKNAANRLVIKYGLANRGACTTCNTSSSSAITLEKNLITKFQNNPDLFKKFTENSLGLQVNSFQNVTTLSVDKTHILSVPPCCPVAFYGCITVCAATIELFPAYMICCGGCYLGTCCS